ncbi:EF hand [Tranquillimonas rosea]|uniref:EF hand n=1 Tax=Tranquillimonas rosea TaxID=641238 RepID=A0A1H9WRG7_9RHOB|nr:EF-hand domain-containing protein [Tranquillimonas rosea]SES35983.1 EF hand [Tranquillimonas rosea]
MGKSILALAITMAAAVPAAAQTGTLDGSNLAALDTNGDGAVSQEEFAVFVNAAFQQMDTNGDGSLTEAELDPHLTTDSIATLDTDGNGVVSPQEFSTRMSQDFAAADQDGDGMLN